MPQQSMHQQIVLASTSRYRADALKQLRLSFTTADPQTQEIPQAGEQPNDLALRLAHQKAAAVAQHYPQAIVIGADQVGYCQGQQLSKPGTIDNAVAQLCAVSGQRAQFYSALALHDPLHNRCLDAVVVTELTFRQISTSQAQHYVAVDNPLDCAGAFKVESLGIALFTEVRSNDPSALIGLPLIALVDMLNQCGIHPL